MNNEGIIKEAMTRNIFYRVKHHPTTLINVGYNLELFGNTHLMNFFLFQSKEKSVSNTLFINNIFGNKNIYFLQPEYICIP